jgi:hypothetical protein
MTQEQISKDKTLDKIDVMLKSSNKSEVKDSTILAVFVRTVGMTRSYKIYYVTNKGNVIEAYVNNDIFRGKSYILSMYVVIQKVN